MPPRDHSVQSRVVPALSLGGPLVLSEQFLNTRQQAARGPGLSCDRAAEVGWGAREPRPHGCPPPSLPGVPNWEQLVGILTVPGSPNLLAWAGTGALSGEAMPQAPARLMWGNRPP